MTASVFGMIFSRPSDEPAPILAADLFKPLLIESSADADATAYPVGTTARISADDAPMVAKLGTGMPATAVRCTNDQPSSVNASADETICRVTEGVNTVVTTVDIAKALSLPISRSFPRPSMRRYARYGDAARHIGRISTPSARSLLR